MKPTSVIIMDTHPIIRMSIEVLLQKNSELQIVLKTDDYRITIDYLRTRPVDLIIMDIDLPGTDGFTFLKVSIPTNHFYGLPSAHFLKH